MKNSSKKNNEQKSQFDVFKNVALPETGQQAVKGGEDSIIVEEYLIG